MDVLAFRDYCLSLPLTEECTPFDETTLVYKVGGKMYAYADMENFGRVAVKCDPDEAAFEQKALERHPHDGRPARCLYPGADPQFLPARAAAERYAQVPARGDTGLCRGTRPARIAAVPDPARP